MINIDLRTNPSLIKSYSFNNNRFYRNFMIKKKLNRRMLINQKKKLFVLIQRLKNDGN